MNNIEKIRKMVEMQVALNESTNGPDWLTGVSKNGKSINWTICTIKEVSEMIDCFPWKHWKDVNGTFDVENYKMELVDVYHFLMSGIIEVVYRGVGELPQTTEEGKEAVPLTHEDKLKFAIDRTVEVLCYDRIDTLLPRDVIEEKILSVEDFNYEEELFNLTASLLTEVINLESTIERILFIVCMLEHGYGFTFDNVYKLYIGKNVLNVFRQDHGYAEGTYIKIWNGEEDNVYLSKLIDNGMLDPEELTKELEVKYDTITSLDPEELTKEMYVTITTDSDSNKA